LTGETKLGAVKSMRVENIGDGEKNMFCDGDGAALALIC
jgi:hypothetical protein